jgi:hypothetical protein
MFRTAPILVDDTNVEVLLKDLDGATPVTLYLENLDIHGSLTQKWGSKNGNAKFTAVEAGDLAKDINISIELGDDFSIATDDSDPYDVFIVTASDRERDGQLRDRRCQRDDDANDYVTASLAPGSDGSAIINLMGETALSGDSDAVTLGTVHVYHAPTTDSDAWDESTAAGTAFSACAANAVKAFLLDAPVRGLRVTATKGGGDTYVVFTAVRGTWA